MVRSFVALRAVDPGFRARPRAGHERRPSRTAIGARRVRRLYRRRLLRARHPRAGAPARRALRRRGDALAARRQLLRLLGFEIENFVPRAAGDTPDSQGREVAGDYFAALGVPLVRGRVFSAADDHAAPPVVVVNQAIAKRWWPNEDRARQAPARQGAAPRAAALGDGRRHRRRHARLRARSAARKPSHVFRARADAPLHDADADRAHRRRSDGRWLPPRAAALAEIDPEQPVFNVQHDGRLRRALAGAAALLARA